MAGLLKAAFNMKDIGDRMKRYYEDRNRTYLTRRTPVIIRLDGRAFHTYTRNFVKPFDRVLIESMQETTRALIQEAQGAVLGYTQSDEISLLLCDWQSLTSEGWFDYNVQKMVSVSASFTTCAFNAAIFFRGYAGASASWAQFDARCFSIPIHEVSNYFLWRAKDWHRNSIIMYAQKFFSHQELHGKNVEAIHEMLYSIGKNWVTDLNRHEKNGTFYGKEGEVGMDECTKNYAEINRLVLNALP